MRTKIVILSLSNFKTCTLNTQNVIVITIYYSNAHVHGLSKRIQTPANMCHNGVNVGKNRSITLLIEHRACLQTLICAN